MKGNNDRGFSEFCKQPFLHTESVRTMAPFWGIKSAWQMCYLMGKKQFWKKDASVYSFNLRNYLLRLHVHPYFIKYHSLVYLTLCNWVCWSSHYPWQSLCHVKPKHIWCNMNGYLGFNAIFWVNRDAERQLSVSCNFIIVWSLCVHGEFRDV